MFVLSAYGGTCFILARFTLARLVSALGGRIFTDSMRFNYPQDCFACIALCLSLRSERVSGAGCAPSDMKVCRRREAFARGKKGIA